jgi:hypothetical protein
MTPPVVRLNRSIDGEHAKTPQIANLRGLPHKRGHCHVGWTISRKSGEAIRGFRHSSLGHMNRDGEG